MSGEPVTTAELVTEVRRAAAPLRAAMAAVETAMAENVCAMRACGEQAQLIHMTPGETITIGKPTLGAKPMPRLTIVDAKGRATEVRNRIRIFGTRHPLTLATGTLLGGFIVGVLVG